MLRARFLDVLVVLLLSFPSYSFAESSPRTLVMERIVGGQQATRGDWPFMAALVTPGYPLLQGQFCGGSIIDSKWILTAAHCVDGKSPQELQVALGVFDLEHDSGEIIGVKTIHVHPSYQVGADENNDIALLELQSQTTQPKVALVSSSSESPVGADATVIGWGLTDPNNDNSYVAILREVTMPIVSNETCSVKYGSELTSSMMCAGLAEGGKDSCQGDSGGPLLVQIGNEWKQAGIVSWGTGCAAAGYYGVYSRVAELRAFVDQYVTTDETPVDTGEKSTKYGTWNGFLDMVNVLELMNRTVYAQEVRISVYNMSGQLASINKRTVQPNQQLDVTLNSLPGFVSNAYGLVKIESRIESRVFYYRPTDSSFTSFEYAFGVEVGEAITGTSFVGFNTFQPSFKGDDRNNLVANWLSVVNLSTSKKTFTVNKYGIQGNKLSSSKVEIPALGRADLDGGHINPGPSNVGLIEIVPTDTTAPYLSQLMRYGYAASGGIDFAFPLIAGSGSASNILLPGGSDNSAQNWLEVVNTSNTATTADIRFYEENGQQKKQQNISLGAHAQIHIDVSSIFGSMKIGSIKITPLGTQKLIAQSMFYFFKSDLGIAAMYGIQGEVGATSIRTGSYNLFLDMENYLRITNFSDSAGSYALTISSASAAGSSQTFAIEAHQTVNLALDDVQTYGTAKDTYGVVSITPNNSTLSLSQIVRVGHDSSNEIEFAAPTSMK